MKTRLDFVSNSSSSSFIVINDTGKYASNADMAGMSELSLPSDAGGGCTEFGWQLQKYYDVFSKLNWAALVILA